MTSRLLGTVSLCAQCRACLKRTGKRLQTRQFRTGRQRLEKTPPTSVDLTKFPVDRIRNFAIIAHIDHGKSTLADRLLEATQTISVTKQNKQVLDKLQVERERGITVKAQTASVIYRENGTEYLLNLIDTPGHVDFSFEVARSLIACQGVVLVVDASQGVQAQTLANFYLAMEHDLRIIPVLNKIDLQTANVERVAREMESIFGTDPGEIIPVSAKNGTNIMSVFKAIVSRLPSPADRDQTLFKSEGGLKALLFDSMYEAHRGVVSYIAVMNGKLATGDKITTHLLATEDKRKPTYKVKEVGILHPDKEETGVLYPGQVGYVACGMKSTKEAQLGDTMFHVNHPVAPLSGFDKAKPVVFGAVYPTVQNDYTFLQSALNRLALNDRSVTMESSSSYVLGDGFRMGFLGLLHMEVFWQRLQQEYDAKIVVTPPSVPYKAELKANTKRGVKEGTVVDIKLPSDFPEMQYVERYLQPVVVGTIFVPNDFAEDVRELCTKQDGVLLDSNSISDTRVMLVYRLPLSEILVDFYDQLKSISSGYASFDYDEVKYETANLVKIRFLINGIEVEELTKVCPSAKAQEIARATCLKIRNVYPSQLHATPIQAVLGTSNVIARETRPAIKKNVLANSYPGDWSRKLKQLNAHAEKQRKAQGKHKPRLPKDTLVELLKI